MRVLELGTVLLVSVAMALSLAHALELPGKMRLDERTYRAVQGMYYPGFTWGGGIGEFGGLVATAVLLAVTPRGTAGFVLTLAALACLLGMQAVYWTVTHPVNRVWVAQEPLGRGGSKFFATGRQGVDADWTKLRARWEYSHVARAVLGLGAFLSLLLMVSIASISS